MKDHKRAKEVLISVFPFLVYTMYNLFLHINGFMLDSDDVFVRGYGMPSSIQNELSIVIREYKSWSSRFLINLVSRLLCQMNDALWILWDVAVLTLLFWCVDRLINPERIVRRRYVLLGAMLIFPFYLSIETGWIVGTTSYILPILFGVLACFSVRLFVDKKKIHWYIVILLVLATVIAANKEEMSVMLAVFFFFMFVYSLYCSRFDWCFLIQFIVSGISVLYHATCVGNQTRVSWGENGGPHVGFFDKVESGFWSALVYPVLHRHFSLVVLSLIVVLCLTIKCKKAIKPTIIGTIVASGSVAKLVYDRQGWLARLYESESHISDGKYASSEMILAGVLAILLFLTLFFSITDIVGRSSKLFMLVLILMCALLGHVPVGFGGIDSRYYERSYTFMYFAFSLIIALLFDDLISEANDRTKQRLTEVFVTLAGMGIVFNLFGCNVL